MHMQGGLQSSSALSPSGLEPSPSEVLMQQHISTSTSSDSKKVNQPSPFPGSNKRSKIAFYKPCVDGHKWTFSRNYRTIDDKLRKYYHYGNHYCRAITYVDCEKPQNQSKDSGNVNENLGTQANPESRMQPQASKENNLSEGMAHMMAGGKEAGQATTEHFSSDEKEVGDVRIREPRGNVYGPDAKRRSIKKPKIIIPVTSEVGVPFDGYKWYYSGQRSTKDNPYPRYYYNCDSKQCDVKKRVQCVESLETDRKTYRISYFGNHNHEVTVSK